MIPVYPVADPAPKVFCVPRFGETLVTPGLHCLATMGKNPSCALAHVFREPRQWHTQGYGRPGRRFPYVYLPFGVCGVGNVQSDPGETMCFFLRPCPASSKAEPAPRQQEAPVAVYVEALLSCPAVRPGRIFMCGGVQSVLVRKDMCLSLHLSPGGCKSGDRRRPCRRMASQEWIPWPDRPIIYGQHELGLGALQEAVEDHRKMTLHLVDQVEEILLSKPGRDDPVIKLPEHQGSMLPAVQGLQHVFGARRSSFQQIPAIIFTGCKYIEIPTQAIESTQLATRNGEPSALREGGRLRSEEHTSELQSRENLV